MGGNLLPLGQYKNNWTLLRRSSNFRRVPRDRIPEGRRGDDSTSDDTSADYRMQLCEYALFWRLHVYTHVLFTHILLGGEKRDTDHEWNLSSAVSFDTDPVRIDLWSPRGQAWILSTLGRC